MDWLDTEHKKYTNYTMSACDWDRLNEYALSSGARLLFDLNLLLQRPDGSWDPGNAQELMEYTVSQHYYHNIDWELGNEPSSLHRQVNRTVNATQLARDFLRLYQVVRTSPLCPYFQHSLLVGPDITRPRKKSLNYLKQYLEITKNKLNAVTWHQYYIDGRTATVRDFTDPKILDNFPKAVKEVKRAVTESGLQGVPIWLGETGSAWGGGAPGISDKYVAGFLYLDKLGVAATLGMSVVVRQSWFGGHYAMIDHDLNPNPDYWAALLHKQLMGTRVLNVSTSQTASHAGVRVYAHCAHPSRYSNGSVALLMLNTKTKDVRIQLKGEVIQHVIEQYLLTPADQSLLSQTVLLNGQQLKMLSDSQLPPLSPKVLPPGSEVTIPSLTFGIWVIRDAQAKACFA